jgi:hypothetical protein
MKTILSIIIFLIFSSANSQTHSINNNIGKMGNLDINIPRDMRNQNYSLALLYNPSTETFSFLDGSSADSLKITTSIIRKNIPRDLRGINAAVLVTYNPIKGAFYFYEGAKNDGVGTISTTTNLIPSGFLSVVNADTIPYDIDFTFTNGSAIVTGKGFTTDERLYNSGMHSITTYNGQTYQINIVNDSVAYLKNRYWVDSLYQFADTTTKCYPGNIANGLTSFAFGRSNNLGDHPRMYAFGSGNISVGGESSMMVGNGNRMSAGGSFAAGALCSVTDHLSFSMGLNNTAGGFVSYAFGQDCSARGSKSFVGGFQSQSLPNAATSFGWGHGITLANEQAFSFGLFNTASGYNSAVYGRDNIGSGNYTSTFGYQNKNKSYMSFMLGQWADTTSISPTAWNASDPLFTIGNGTANNLRNNAVTVLKNSRVGINQRYPNSMLDVNGSVNVSDSVKANIIYASTGIETPKIILDSVNIGNRPITIKTSGDEFQVTNKGYKSLAYESSQGGYTSYFALYSPANTVLNFYRTNPSYTGEYTTINSDNPYEINVGGTKMIIGDLGVYSGYLNKNVLFQVGDNTESNRITLSSNGMFGIGYDRPKSKLDINGSANVSDSLKASIIYASTGIETPKITTDTLYANVIVPDVGGGIPVIIDTTGWITLDSLRYRILEKKTPMSCAYVNHKFGSMVIEIELLTPLWNFYQHRFRMISDSINSVKILGSDATVNSNVAAQIFSGDTIFLTAMTKHSLQFQNLMHGWGRHGYYSGGNTSARVRLGLGQTTDVSVNIPTGWNNLPMNFSMESPSTIYIDRINTVMTVNYSIPSTSESETPIKLVSGH